MFDKKAWVDRYVITPGVLGLRDEPSPLQLYSFLWNGEPPTDVMVFLLAGKTRRTEEIAEEDSGGWAAVARAAAAMGRVTEGQLGAVIDGFDAEAWGRHVKRLLDSGWHLDFTREPIMVKLGDGLVPIFGGDGAPIFSKDGMCSVRLFRKVSEDSAPDSSVRSCNLILQIGCKFPDGTAAIAGVKAFFGLFDGNALETVQKYAAPFGAA